MKVDIHCINCKVRIYVADSEGLKSPLDGGMFELPHQMEWPVPGAGVRELDLVCPFCGYTFHDKDRILYYGVAEMMPDEAKELFRLSDEAIDRQENKPVRTVSDDELALYLYKGERPKRKILAPPEKVSLSRETRRFLRGKNA